MEIKPIPNTLTNNLGFTDKTLVKANTDLLAALNKPEFSVQLASRGKANQRFQA